MSEIDLSKNYQDRIPILEKVAKEIKINLEELLSETPRIDKISTRVKKCSRFVEKANRLDHISGNSKYKYPLEEIQDQIGARAVVFYKSDVEPVTKKIKAEIREVEDQKIEPEPEYFGYEGRHFICFIPLDIYHKYNSPIDFFELQISTLFQHAWAQANHDLGYKPQRELSYEEQRKIAWTAAQAWGADQVFDELWNKSENK